MTDYRSKEIYGLISAIEEKIRRAEELIALENNPKPTTDQPTSVKNEEELDDNQIKELSKLHKAMISVSSLKKLLDDNNITNNFNDSLNAMINITSNPVNLHKKIYFTILEYKSIDKKYDEMTQDEYTLYIMVDKYSSEYLDGGNEVSFVFANEKNIKDVRNPLNPRKKFTKLSEVLYMIVPGIIENNTLVTFKVEAKENETNTQTAYKLPTLNNITADKAYKSAFVAHEYIINTYKLISNVTECTTWLKDKGLYNVDLNKDNKAYVKLLRYFDEKLNPYELIATLITAISNTIKQANPKTYPKPMSAEILTLFDYLDSIYRKITNHDSVLIVPERSKKYPKMEKVLYADYLNPRNDYNKVVETYLLGLLTSVNDGMPVFKAMVKGSM